MCGYHSNGGYRGNVSRDRTACSYKLSSAIGCAGVSGVPGAADSGRGVMGGSFESESEKMDGGCVVREWCEPAYMSAMLQ